MQKNVYVFFSDTTNPQPDDVYKENVYIDLKVYVVLFFSFFLFFFKFIGII
jgi:hypothetical protein